MSEIAESLIRMDRFGRAEEFIAALRPIDPRWRSTDDVRWLFRGQGDTNDPVPRILRGGRWKSLLLNDAIRQGAEDPRQRDYWRWRTEVEALLGFIEVADRSGLAVPEDGQAIRSVRILRSKILGNAQLSPDGLCTPEWPPIELLSPLALAQHYGVPTRLLDWTWRPLVAAYFAAAGAVREPERNGDVAVWALRPAFVEHAWINVEREPVPFAVVTAPQAGNPNLAAQAGAFTLSRLTHDDVGLSEVLRRRVVDLEANASGPPFWLLPVTPALVQLSLPRIEAPRLLHLLGVEGVTAATIYPGYGGVVTALDERRLWRP